MIDIGLPVCAGNTSGELHLVWNGREDEMRSDSSMEGLQDVVSTCLTSVLTRKREDVKNKGKVLASPHNQWGATECV